MSLRYERPIDIGLKLQMNHPQLLAGLDNWLRLGLISDVQVRQICREYLTCKLISSVEAVKKAEIPREQSEKISTFSNTENKKNPETSVTPGLISLVFQSLLAELSVKWLLFLGMFLVVLSSGVLAASQWERFPASGQYSVLWAYTLSFWGVSFWAGKQENLKLTAGTLLVVTLLLIPVNFWAMDSFQLWQHPFDWSIVAFASISLTFVANSLCKHPLFAKHFPIQRLYLLNLIGLSYLHWGWKLPGVTLYAVYAATIGTTVITVLQLIKRQDISEEQSAQKTEKVELNSERKRNGENNSYKDIKTNLKTNLDIGLPTAVIVYSLLVILSRAIFVVGVDITKLGLAFGFSGWLIAWLGSRSGGDDKVEKSKKQDNHQPSIILPWQLIGSILMGFGWFVSFYEHPLQAFAISGLAIHFFHVRLHKYYLRLDIVIVFLVGLQSFFLGWRLIPLDTRSLIVTIIANITNVSSDYWLLLSLALFPYVIAFAALSDKLHQSGKVKLARFSEILNLCLGLLLTQISLFNPTLRSINLLLSTATLITISSRYTFTYKQEFQKIPLILPYLANIAIISTICSWLDLYLPKILPHYWAAILLFLMIAEFCFCVSNTIWKTWNIWKKSAWHIGFGLALASWIIFYNNFYPNPYQITSVTSTFAASWGLTWFATPITLSAISTGLISNKTKASRNFSWFNQINIYLSIATLCLAQILTFPVSEVRLAGLGIAAVLMYWNTKHLQVRLNALITIGFSLAFIGNLLWDNLPDRSLGNLFLIVAATIFSLWGIRRAILSRIYQKKDNNQNNRLKDKDSIRLTVLYADAINIWAILLCGLEIFSLTTYTSILYSDFSYYINPTFPTKLPYIIATVVTLSAIWFQSWRNPNIWKFYGIAWCLELIVAQTLSFGTTSFIRIAIANIFLSLTVQLFGGWWKRKHNLTTLPPRWNILPLAYGLFGVILRFGTFADWTGLSSLAVSLIIIGIGKRDRKLKPLLYLGIIGVSISAYELLIYQISQAHGDTFGDAFIVMAALGAGIMSIYQILSPWLRGFLGLSRSEIKAISHIHWGFSSALIVGAISAPVAQYSLGFGIGVVLVRYAVFQGRVYVNSNANSRFSKSNSQSNFSNSQSTRNLNTQDLNNRNLKDISPDQIWVYLGLIEACLIRIYLLETPIGKIIFTSELRPWQAGLTCIVAYFLHILPWNKLGWSKQPWQNAAYALPLIFVYLTRFEIYSVTLLIVAAFYVFLAVITKKFRTTYISLLLFNWSLWKWLIQMSLTDTIWYTSLIGLSLLYIAQFDRYLQLPKSKEQRHLIRLLGVGMICIWATLFHQDNGFLPGILSIIAIFAGLALRIRAFLYVGTFAFLSTSFYQLVLYIERYPFTKWVVGLIIGIMFIAIAANFENRRTQISSLLRNANSQLKQWE